MDWSIFKRVKVMGMVSQICFIDEMETMVKLIGGLAMESSVMSYGKKKAMSYPAVPIGPVLVFKGSEPSNRDPLEVQWLDILLS
jgi:hypothetical protein